MQLKIKRLHPQAVLPRRATPESAGLDLCACLDGPLTIEPFALVKVPTGLAIALEPGTVGFVYPRSGLASKFGVTLSNCVGVIDSDYRGELLIAMTNHSRQPYTIRPGDRVAQLVVTPILLPEAVWAEELDETARGEILDAVSAHVMGDTNGAYNFYAADGGAEFSFATGAGAIGVPGSGTTAYYAPETVFGVFEGCEDVGAAWDFLRLLYSDEIQAKTSGLPVTASALDAYIDEELDEESAPAFRELLENTRAAVGVNTVMDETKWYTDWYNANAVENT